MINDDENEVVERPEYHAVEVCLMDCKPGNFDDATGESCTIVTISREDLIEPLVFRMQDARKLITKALIALATCEDDFAQKVLGDHFDADDDGSYIWPRS